MDLRVEYVQIIVPSRRLWGSMSDLTLEQYFALKLPKLYRIPNNMLGNAHPRFYDDTHIPSYSVCVSDSGVRRFTENQRLSFSSITVRRPFEVIPVTTCSV